MTVQVGKLSRGHDLTKACFYLLKRWQEVVTPLQGHVVDVARIGKCAPLASCATRPKDRGPRAAGVASPQGVVPEARAMPNAGEPEIDDAGLAQARDHARRWTRRATASRSEEHTSELQPLQ